VRVRFLDKIKTQDVNLTEFYKIIKVNVIAGEYNDPTKLNFTWNVTDFTTDYLTLQLYFTTPQIVSFDVY
jgi:hypothetical protein